MEVQRGEWDEYSMSKRGLVISTPIYKVEGVLRPTSSLDEQELRLHCCFGIN